jgi:SAM-dependent methyltransferase
VTTNLWVNEEHALSYLRERESLPHRVDALEVLCELLPDRVERVLDLGTGDGITLGLVLAARPGATGIGLDFGAEMLRRAEDRFAGDARSAPTTSKRRFPARSGRSISWCRASRSTTSRPPASARSTGRCSQG